MLFLSSWVTVVDQHWGSWICFLAAAKRRDAISQGILCTSICLRSTLLQFISFFSVQSISDISQVPCHHACRKKPWWLPLNTLQHRQNILGCRELNVNTIKFAVKGKGREDDSEYCYVQTYHFTSLLGSRSQCSTTIMIIFPKLECLGPRAAFSCPTSQGSI